MKIHLNELPAAHHHLEKLYAKRLLKNTASHMAT